LKRVCTIIVLSTILLFLMVEVCSAQRGAFDNRKIRFDHLDLSDGLPVSSTRTVTQDSFGFIWVATDNGVFRYDGSEFIQLNNDYFRDGSLNDGLILDLVEGPSRMIWIATEREGLNVYNPFAREIRQVPLKDNEGILHSNYLIRRLLFDSQNRLWICTAHGLFMLKRGEITPEIVPVKAENSKLDYQLNTTAIFESQDGQIVIGTDTKGLLIYDDENGELQHKKLSIPGKSATIETRITTVIQDINNDFWLGIDDVGIVRFDSRWQFEQLYDHAGMSTKKLDQGFGLRCSFLDSNDRLWFGTESSGLLLYDYKTKNFIVYYNDPLDQYSLSDPTVESIYEDSSGQLWICTVVFINLINPIHQNFAHESNVPGLKTSINSRNVFGMYVDRSGRLWLGTTEWELNVREPGEREFRHIGTEEYPQFESLRAVDFYEDSLGLFWVASGHNGLIQLNYESGEVKLFAPEDDNPASLLSVHPHQIIEDSEGNLWIATLDGLSKYDRNQDTFTNYTVENGLPGNNIFAIALENDDILWVATTKGLARYDILTDTWYQFLHDPDDNRSLSNDIVYTLLIDSRGDLWAGTAKGLNRYNRENQDFHRITAETGLKDDFIYSLLEDKNGYLWVSTNNGIARISTANGEIRNFDKADGLQDNEFNSFAGYYDELDDVMYFGGINGISYFRPTELKLDVIEPNLVVTDVKASGQKPPIFADIYTVDSINIPPQLDNLEIKYSAMDHSADNKIQYRFRLVGYENSWQNSGTFRKAVYYKVPPGSYKFQVQSTNRWGEWQNNLKELDIYLEYEYWQTPLFRIAIIVLFVMTVIFAYVYRIRLIRAQRANLQALVEEQTKDLKNKNQELEAFSHSVSHDLRSPLRRIYDFSEQLLSELNLDKTSYEHGLLNRIHNISREGNELIEDLLKFSRFDYDFIDTQQINISNLALDVITNLRNEEPDRNIRIEVEENLTAYCDARMAKVLLQNLFSNAIKFTNHTSNPIIRFGQLHEHKEKPFFIEDSGIGFDMNKADQLFTPFKRLNPSKKYKGTGIGLSLAKRIVERHGGRIWAEAELDKGATFYFTFPDSK
jgi:ligand-binding sensor domain-containing protein/signal transduction histidine kinase